MVYSLSVVCLVLTLLFAGSHQFDNGYCDADYCEPGLKNVGCNPPPVNGGPACLGKEADNPYLGPFNTDDILHEHNRLRSQLARGLLGSFAPAARMPALVWDNELADQASRNVRSCRPGHDQCRNTKQFRHVGQNIAVYRYTGPVIFTKHLLAQRMHDWSSEFNVTTQTQLDQFPSLEPKSQIAHFTQMVSDRAWKIGCSVQLWLDEKVYNVFYLVCNYSFDNFVGQPVYVKGKPASNCTTGMHPKYPGLCSENERVSSTPDAIAN